MDLSQLFDPDLIPRPVLAFGGTVASDGLELAFHRHRVARGWTPRDADAVARETHYLQSLVELRGRLGG